MSRFCGHQLREEAESSRTERQASGQSFAEAVGVVEVAMSEDKRVKTLFWSTMNNLRIELGRWEQGRAPGFQDETDFEEAAAVAGAIAGRDRRAKTMQGRGFEDSWSLFWDLGQLEGISGVLSFVRITFSVVLACLMTDLVMFDAFSRSVQSGEREGAAVRCATRVRWRQSAKIWAGVGAEIFKMRR